jgi:hypothetical protein
MGVAMTRRKSADQKKPLDSLNTAPPPAAEPRADWIASAERDTSGRDAEENVKWDEV